MCILLCENSCEDCGSNCSSKCPCYETHRYPSFLNPPVMLRDLFELHKASRLCVELSTVFVVFSRFGAKEGLCESFVDLSGKMILLKHVLKELSLEAYEAENEMSSCLGFSGFENIEKKHVYVSNLDDCLSACQLLWQHVCVLLPKISERCNRGRLLVLNDSEVAELSSLSFRELQFLHEDLDKLYNVVFSCRVFIE